MTLTITDLGDEWNYDTYTVNRDATYGLCVELTGPLEDLPWQYARTVEVAVRNDYFDIDFTGFVETPSASYDFADGVSTVTAIVSEGLPL